MSVESPDFIGVESSEVREDLLPQVYYHRSLKGAPYDILVDRERYAEFLLEHSIPQEDIPRLKIRLRRRGWLLHGDFNKRSWKMTLNAEFPLSFRRSTPSSINNELTKTLLHESRHVMDARSASVSVLRGAVVAGAMLGFAFVHSLVVDSYTDSQNARQISGLIAMLYGGCLGAMFPPDEIRAQLFARKESADFRWKEIIKVQLRKSA